MEGRDVRLAAGGALDRGEVAIVLDAVHLADALQREGKLHTADERLWRTAYPTARF